MPAPAEIIRTERLDLVPFTPEFLRASIDGNLATAAEILGAILPEYWPDVPDTLGQRLKQLEDDPSLLPWLLRGMVLRSERRLIGHIGFHTGPNPAHLRELSPGGMEFGYTVFASHRRRGFAAEAATGLMHWARTGHGIDRFVVSIAPTNLPSRALAAKLGFRRIGSHIDEEDGPEDIFERVLD